MQQANVDLPTAGQIMNSRVESLDPETPISQAIALLLKRGYSGAPVVDKNHRLIGILSEFDCIQTLARAAYERWPDGAVKDHMTPSPTTIDVQADLFAIAQCFTQAKARRIPVVDATGTLLGLISRRDLLRELDRMANRRHEHPPTTYEMIAQKRQNLSET
jgi:CBS domain-containing protein